MMMGIIKSLHVSRPALLFDLLVVSLLCLLFFFIFRVTPGCYFSMRFFFVPVVCARGETLDAVDKKIQCVKDQKYIKHAVHKRNPSVKAHLKDVRL
jgi:hypothetical protein